MKTAIYVRSACANDAALVEQEKAIRQYIGKKDQVYRVYKDNGYSGDDLNRPGLRQLLLDAENRKFKSIMVSTFDRLSRSFETCSTLRRKIEDLGIVLKSKDADLSSPIGRFQSRILMTFVDYDREVRSERIKIGLKKKQAKKKAPCLS